MLCQRWIPPAPHKEEYQMSQPLRRIVLTLIALGALVADPVAAPPSVTLAGTVTDASDDSFVIYELQ